MLTSIDFHPWEHPFLLDSNIADFRSYSDLVYEYIDTQTKNLKPLKCVAMSDNMAQNMLKWGLMLQRQGVKATLVPNPMETTAINHPKWEFYEGDFKDIYDSNKFDLLTKSLSVDLPIKNVEMRGDEILKFANIYKGKIISIKRNAPRVYNELNRYQELLKHEGCYPYYEWARELSKYDITYTAGTPVAAYATGRPYLAFSVGGDLQINCGKRGPYWRLLTKSFQKANFLLISNPVTLAHSRRLGLRNGIYLPYPMDEDKYSPGIGKARIDWIQRTGKDFFILTTNRIDSKVKGTNSDLVKAMTQTLRESQGVAFVFIEWGESVAEFKEELTKAGIENSVIFVNPVGKVKLIDYYRSADIVLDQLSYGYFGATALEAMSIGKPVVMFLRQYQYFQLYKGDIAPIQNISGAMSIKQELLQLIHNKSYRINQSKLSRAWILRNHAENVAGRKLMNLLVFAASGGRIPISISSKNPLQKPISIKELKYHISLRFSNPKYA